MTIDPHIILTGRTTNIVLRSLQGKWTIGNPGKPSFTLSGGATGDTISEQTVLDPNTAVISLKSSLTNAILTINDTVNNEACSISVGTAANLIAAGVQPVDNFSVVHEGHRPTGK